MKFYEKKWFIILMMFLVPPYAIYLLWKKTQWKKSVKIVLTIVLSFFTLIFINAFFDQSNSEGGLGSNKEEILQKEVTVLDFSNMPIEDIKAWSETNKIKLYTKNIYSNDIEKGAFISQSINSNKKISEGMSLTVIYSLGKEPKIEYKNALKKAENYASIMNMSKKAIYDQLISPYGEKFPEDAAQYAMDNIVAKWNENALAKAKIYQTTMSMSKSAIYDQLVSQYGEKFTNEEAQYAINNLE
ncbi:MAG: Ltp family lipoprotein [Bacilli bacterium]